MPVCEICSFHEAFGRFEVLDSHIFSKFKTEMWLCRYCYDDLKKYGVELKEVFIAEPQTEAKQEWVLGS